MYSYICYHIVRCVSVQKGILCSTKILLQSKSDYLYIHTLGGKATGTHQYITWLVINLTPRGVVLSFFSSCGGSASVAVHVCEDSKVVTFTA